VGAFRMAVNEMKLILIYANYCHFMYYSTDQTYNNYTPKRSLYVDWDKSYQSVSQSVSPPFVCGGFAKLTLFKVCIIEVLFGPTCL